MTRVGRPRKNTYPPASRDLLFDLLKKTAHHEKKLRAYAEVFPRHSCTKELLISKADTLDLVRDWIHILLLGQSLEKDGEENETEIPDGL